MKIPDHFLATHEWTLLGPMGPKLPSFLAKFPIIGVDGGAQFSERLDIWIGDSDSGLPHENCPISYRYPPEKSASDLALCLQLLKHIPRLKLHLWGFTGGRKDHELINLGECLSFLESMEDSEIHCYDSQGKVLYRFFGKGQWSFSHQGIFSLVTLKPQSLTLTGLCDYQVPERREFPPLSSMGLSNQARGQLHLQTDGPVLFIFSGSA
jgi:thiamine pyrophosphokinase